MDYLILRAADVRECCQKKETAKIIAIVNEIASIHKKVMAKIVVVIPPPFKKWGLRSGGGGDLSNKTPPPLSFSKRGG